MFLDEAVVEFASGRGGNGSATFHREKHVPRGGPNGADGGRGGDVVLVADHHVRTLYDFKLRSRYKAEDGGDAHGNKSGKDGADIEVRVPIGTIVWSASEDVEPVMLADLTADGAKYVICRGGRGGYGNLHFTNSVRQVPTFAQKGEPAEQVRARLELKLLADVGIVGLPNAGKSTLIARISAARPKIADYPFTTIVPNLGVVSFGGTTFTAADMPGLIEGAHEGHGLGHQFLRHVERTKVLIHLVDAAPIDGSEPVANFDLIERELAKYSDALAEPPRIVALNKADLARSDDLEALAATLSSKLAGGGQVHTISAVTGQGIEQLLYAVVRLLEEAERRPAAATIKPVERKEGPEPWEVVRDAHGYRVRGRGIERMVAMTDLAKDEALRHLHRRLERIGVIERLREEGAQEGDSVFVGDIELVYEE